MMKMPRSNNPLRILGVVAALFSSVVRGDDIVADQVPVRRRGTHSTELGMLFDTQVFGRSLDADAKGSPRSDALPDAITLPDLIARRLAPLRQQAVTRIAAVDRIVRLSDAQRKKLEIAVRSDMQRLVDAVVESRATFANRTITTDPSTGQFDEAGMKLMQAVSQESNRCRQLMQQAFGPQSLVAKVLVGGLDEKQAEIHAAAMRERAICRWKAVVAAGLTAFDDRMGLTQKQYDAVTAKLVADPPPLDDEFSPIPAAVIVAKRLTSLGDEKLVTLLDPRQRQLVAAVAQSWQAAAGGGVAVAEGDAAVEPAPAVDEFRVEVR